MNVGKFQLVKDSGDVFRDSSDSDPHLMQAKPIIAARIIATFVLLLVSSPIDASDPAAVPAVVQPATFEGWPAGTRLHIPNRVMKSYQEEANSWTYPHVYHFANYFITGPSLQDDRKDTVYLPYVKKQAGKAEQSADSGIIAQREVWIDISNIRRISVNPSVHVTDGDMRIIVINLAGEDRYVGVRVEH